MESWRAGLEEEENLIGYNAVGTPPPKKNSHFSLGEFLCSMDTSCNSGNLQAPPGGWQTLLIELHGKGRI